MKLICCVRCNEVFNLTPNEYKECNGGHGGGQYVDQVNAKVWGDPTIVFVLGFANSTLASALRDQRTLGDQPADFYYAGKMTPKGRNFTAFVIPDAADSVERVLERFEPVEPAILSHTVGGKRHA